jgi:hypothetical protein
MDQAAAASGGGHARSAGGLRTAVLGSAVTSTALAETPQGCSSKFLTLVPGGLEDVGPDDPQYGALPW